MVKLFSLALSVLVLIQSFSLDIKDLAHIDELIEHANFHSEKYGDNFLVFISKHYGELEKEHKQDHQEEKKEHEELPFSHHCCSHVNSAFVLAKNEIPVIKNQPDIGKRANFHYLENYSSLEKFDIFQPPKAA